jgi:hypothetical protein
MRAGEAFEFQQFAFFRTRRRRDILIELPGVGFRNVAFGKPAHDHVLFSESGPADDDRVADANETMRPRPISVHINLATVARLLRFGPRPKQARNIQPDVET